MIAWETPCAWASPPAAAARRGSLSAVEEVIVDAVVMVMHAHASGESYAGHRRLQAVVSVVRCM